MWTEERLNDLLTTPSAELIEDMKKTDGDIMVLGAGGKMGPTLCVLAKNACEMAGLDKKIIAVSKYGDSDPFVLDLLHEKNVETIDADLMSPEALHALPDTPNILYMAGRKFGTHGQESITWAMNAWLPSFVAERFKKSNIVAFSSGNIYPMVSPRNGGTDETTEAVPVGEYAMSCLGRERVFEYASLTYNTPVCLYRLNYAIDLRYGVLNDLAMQILEGKPITITAPVFNGIWQGDANEMALRCLTLCASPANRVNVTGPETVSVKWAANELGKYLGREPVFVETENDGDEALINNAAKAFSLFGYPKVTMGTLIRWQAEWLLDGGRILNKPTHFEQRKGKF
jgi:hypothetical protein